MIALFDEAFRVLIPGGIAIFETPNPDNLFMASRDRLKDSEETRHLRSFLVELLLKSRLRDIYKSRRDLLSLESGDTSELLKSFTRSTQTI